MSFSVRVKRGSEIQGSQLLGDVGHVVVEVTTDDYRSIGILFDDILCNFCHSHGPLPQVLLFSGLEVAVKNLDILVAELQLGPAEIRSECLHEVESIVKSRRIPSSSTASVHGLERPEPTKVEWGLQIRLTEANHLGSVAFQEIIHDLLFGL
jgi:hypothetical protein